MRDAIGSAYFRKIVVSGASGFIGRRLAVRLKDEHPEADLRCLVKIDDDPFCQRGSEFLQAHSIQPIPVELVSGRGLHGLQSPDLLFHLAANTHTWEKDQSCNDAGAETLMRAVEPMGPNNHVIFTSTVAVADNRPRLDEPLTADTPVTGSPLSLYGRSKWRAEEFLKALAKKAGFRLTILRLCTVYGPDSRPNTFFDVLKREVERRSAVSRLNWPGLTSFIHVDDVVECLLAVGHCAPLPGETQYRLLAAESRTLREVAELLCQARGMPFREIALPKTVWRALSSSHRLCRWFRGRLPANVFNSLWRLNLIINPVFDCDTQRMSQWFPDLKLRRMENCIHEV